MPIPFCGQLDTAISPIRERGIVPLSHAQDPMRFQYPGHVTSAVSSDQDIDLDSCIKTNKEEQRSRKKSLSVVPCSPLDRDIQLYGG